jgi:hypothetical protein
MATLTIILCVVSQATLAQSDTLWHAICTVESHNNPTCIGDNGNALGIAQIWKAVVDDCNRIQHSKTFTYANRTDPEKSRQMFFIYTSHYAPQGTPETVSRVWNGGPKGASKKATLSYWAKVKRVMDSGK